MTCCAVASLPSSPWRWNSACAQDATTAYGSCNDCNRRDNAAKRISIALGSREQRELRPHRIDCNCTYKEISKETKWENVLYTIMFGTCHDVPCGSHGPKQTQQNSVLQWEFLQTMWLQPPSFSIVALHLGHSYINIRNREWSIYLFLFTVNCKM